ncbi:MAG: hypothetical protein APF80_00080 [Alphaproteobacteria bacterium BRH_c36]|nr:MAG: hypothetical protein APF80_00080 [Alphaproteobacteria bacterium BRH_c36]
MFENFRAWLVAVLIGTATTASMALAQSSATTGCFADWSAAATLVEDEKLVTVEALGRQFRHLRLGEIVKTELCRTAGGYVYRLVVRDSKGRFRSVIYDARRGIEIGVAETGR